MSCFLITPVRYRAALRCPFTCLVIMQPMLGAEDPENTHIIEDYNESKDIPSIFSFQFSPALFRSKLRHPYGKV
jgi:hypothetical protein